MLFRFITPNADGTVIDIAIEAITLDKAFEIFAADHWHPDMDGTFAVWCGQRLAARSMPCWNAETGEVTPMYQEFDPPRQQSLACGD